MPPRTLLNFDVECHAGCYSIEPIHHRSSSTIVLTQLVYHRMPAISVVAEAASRTALMTPASRRSLERDDLPLAVELDRYLIETISANRAEPSSSDA